MYPLYLDDSVLFANPDETYFVLGGLSIYEARADWFPRELDKLAESIDPDHPNTVEFHAYTVSARFISDAWFG